MALLPQSTRPARVEGTEDDNRDGPARFAGVPGDLGRLGEDLVAPDSVASGADELVRVDPQPVLANLHLGDLDGTEVLEPVGVTPRARSGAPDYRALRGLEETYEVERGMRFVAPAP